MSLVCHISGVQSTNVCVSKVTGHIYDVDILKEYLQQHDSKCPVNQEPVSFDDDFIILDTGSTSSKNDPSSLTSLDKLSEGYRNILNENYSLRQTLLETRQELSYTLYQFEAACRVISRLRRDGKDVFDKLQE